MSHLFIKTRWIGLAFVVPATLAMGGGAARAQGAWQLYEYDSLGGLVRSWDSTGRSARLAYDNADNRTTASVAQDAVPPQPPPPPPGPRANGYNVIPSPSGTVVVPRPGRN